jgi:simple sugar transport system permease protein
VKKVTRILAGRNVPLFATIGVFVLVAIAAGMRYPNFLSTGVFLNLLHDNAFLGVAAVGMTFVILTGGIDLSVGSMVSLTSISMGVLVTKHHIPSPVLAIALPLGGAVYGSFAGYLISAFELPPFMVTLAGLFLLRGLALLVSLETIDLGKDAFLAGLGGWPFATPIIFLGLLLLGLYLAHFRPFGRNVYAIGGNESSALLMGLPVKRTKILVYALSGFCSALAGVVFTIYTTAGNPTSGNGLELDVIAAVVIGGTLLSGGIGSLVGTLFGVLLLGMIQTIITFEGTLSSWWTRIVIGALLLLFILLQKLVERAGKLSQR